MAGCYTKCLKKRYVETLSEEEYVEGTAALEFSLNLSECVRFKKKGDNLALPLTLCSSISVIFFPEILCIPKTEVLHSFDFDSYVLSNSGFKLSATLG